jgi:tRNA (cytidine/uridine-2'-O-)-methyltransferase
VGRESFRRAALQVDAHGTASLRSPTRMLAVVLVHPEIPPNTGNVIRLTANAGVALHLVEPLGFRLDDRDLRRAGLDYHEYAQLAVHRDLAACRAALDAAAPRNWWAFTTQAQRSAYDARFGPDDVLVFGCETSGLPADLVATFPVERRLRIPMRRGLRSINLSNAVAIGVYEAWRQNGFAGAADFGSGEAS